MKGRMFHQKPARKAPYLKGTAGKKALRVVLDGLLNNRETSVAMGLGLGHQGARGHGGW